MTVCVATIATRGVILCAADRMLSTDSMKYEPEWSKIYTFKASPIAVMWAGDSQIQSEVLQDFSQRVALGAPNPRISDVAYLYVDAYGDALCRRAETKLLKRFRLTLDDFLEGRHQLSPTTVKRLEKRLDEFETGLSRPVAVIIAGLDDLGSHIWTIVNDNANCCDMEGFAAIGSGCEPAVASLRATGFSQRRIPNETLFLTYLAKKRGEAPPTVGTSTDMVILGEGINWGRIDDDILSRVEGAYENFIAAEKQAVRVGFAALEGAMQPLVEAEKARRQAASASADANNPTVSPSDQT